MKPLFTTSLMSALVTTALLAAAPALAQGPDGKALFMKNCAACHQASGKGIPGAFPALAGSKFVTGDHAAVAGVLLKGRGGMPDFSETIDDRDLAAILTYVRSAWDNRADALTEDEIRQLRTTLGVAQYGAAEMSNKH
ncbi:cytochrome C [Duganella sp. Leaf126]|uniref:c-type cytochrome n=1 Tax=Duganella sp. Leaf126 TaxID=1736266 RepID=UPI0006FB14F6|nr:cytochrome c [Duganella sp. Leaf126]KQQ32960.1 cytochrome C [Duganella sp. Leaf126]